jgi:hypothetical protein
MNLSHLSNVRQATLAFLGHRHAYEAEPADYLFAEDEVAELTRCTTDANEAVDSQTWHDLLLDRYHALLASGVSVFGSQVLYRRLRIGSTAEEAASGQARVDALVADPAQLEGLRRKLMPLRHAEADVAGLLFDEARVLPAAPGWLAWVLLLPLLLAASVLLALMVSPAGWIGAAFAMYLLGTIHLRHHEAVTAWRRELFSLHMLLRACGLLDGSGLPQAGELAGRGGPALRLGHALAPSMLAGTEYGKWFLAADVRHYFRTVALVVRELPFLRTCYLACATLEADVALARHLAVTPVWCRATPCAPQALDLEGGLHPLLADARPLSIRLDGKGAFLTGQNGVGKSTFLRTLGLNLVAARAFGICYAGAAALPDVPVIASMQSEDSLLGGHSLYVAELRRAHQLLSAMRARPMVCLIDEIFRGTNHEEAVAAAAAVLDELAQHGLVVVSSHNAVLGPLLAHCLDAWRIARAGDGRLRLERGLLADTNGVALLAAHGFGPDIEARAARVARWLDGHVQRLARDETCAQVLGED